MAEEKKSTFELLSKVNVEGKTKEKGGLTYLPWASAWAEVKKVCPDATFKIYSQIVDEYGNTRFWHDDGRTGWVVVGVTIDGIEIVETLAIMDMRNKAIAANQITSTDANKATKRCLVKACAMHGLGLYIYEGEDLPEEVSRINELVESCLGLIKKKCALSDAAKEKVEVLCKDAEKKANPELPDELLSGSPRNIDDVDILENMKKQLLAVRK